MSNILAGGTAVVTRAGSPLGRAIAIAFAQEGCSKLAIGDLDSAELQETQKSLQSKFTSLALEVISVDVNDEKSTATFFQQVIDKFGRIDFVANIASHESPSMGVHETEESDFDQNFRTNQLSIFFCSKAALGQMLKQDLLKGYESRGSIVNVSSIAGTAALGGTSAYAASMGAVFGWSKTDANDYAEDLIRVNVVAPLMFSDKELAASLDKHPFGRHATVEDVANAVVFLSGPRAAFISGISLPVDGGFHLRTGGPPR